MNERDVQKQRPYETTGQYITRLREHVAGIEVRVTGGGLSFDEMRTLLNTRDAILDTLPFVEQRQFAPWLRWYVTRDPDDIVTYCAGSHNPHLNVSAREYLGFAVRLRELMLAVARQVVEQQPVGNVGLIEALNHVNLPIPEGGWPEEE